MKIIIFEMCLELGIAYKSVDLLTSSAFHSSVTSKTKGALTLGSVIDSCANSIESTGIKTAHTDTTSFLASFICSTVFISITMWFHTCIKGSMILN